MAMCCVCRPAVLMTTSSDGHLDVYDYMYKQNDPALSLQVRASCQRRRCIRQAFAQHCSLQELGQLQQTALSLASLAGRCRPGRAWQPVSCSWLAEFSAC